MLMDSYRNWNLPSSRLSRVSHQQERHHHLLGHHLLAPKRSSDLPVLTPERSDNNFFSRNDSMVPRMR